MAIVLLVLLACSREPAAPTRAPDDVAPALAPRVGAILLARHPELRTSGQAAFTTETVGGIRRAGLRIDPGADVTYAVAIPEGAKLGFEVGTLGEATGTSQLEIDVTRGDATDTVDEIPLLPRLEGLPREVALGPAGPVELRLRNVGALAAFLTEPTVYVPRIDRRVVLLILADTLRRDHLGVYGGEPTPAIDAFAQGAAVFDDAYTVAPWTLPAVRTILSGRWPDEWDPARHLGTEMASKGWFTALLAGSPYLSRDFAMDVGWSWHTKTDGASSKQVERLKELLSVVPDRDVFVVMHVMDAHVPYGAPMAGDVPPIGIDEPMSRTNVVKALERMDPADRKAAIAWLATRYASAVRGLDAALAPVLGSLGPDDVAVLVADHGEELGEHGGWEHGHALTEELVHVPLIVKAPGLAPGHRSEHVSLLDLAPVLSSLATAPFPERAPAFGWLLYGDAQWGLVEGDVKSLTRAREIVSFDLASDPHEMRANSVTDPGAFQTTLGHALDRPVVWTWRVSAPLPLAVRTKVAIDRTAPFENAWVGATPATAPHPNLTLKDNRFDTRWMAGAIFPQEVFLAPGGADAHISISVNDDPPVVLSATDPPGDIGSVGGIHLDHSLQPRAKPTAPGVKSDELKSLGYVE
jgi:hypothetical protein